MSAATERDNVPGVGRVSSEATSPIIWYRVWVLPAPLRPTRRMFFCTGISMQQLHTTQPMVTHSGRQQQADYSSRDEIKCRNNRQQQQQQQQQRRRLRAGGKAGGLG